MNSLRYKKMAKNVPNHYPEVLLFRWKGQNNDLAHFLEDEKTFKLHLPKLFTNLTGIMNL